MGVGWKRIKFIPVTGYFFDSQAKKRNGKENLPSFPFSGGGSGAGRKKLFC